MSSRDDSQHRRRDADYGTSRRGEYDDELPEYRTANRASTTQAVGQSHSYLFPARGATREERRHLQNERTSQSIPESRRRTDERHREEVTRGNETLRETVPPRVLPISILDGPRIIICIGVLR